MIRTSVTGRTKIFRNETTRSDGGKYIRYTTSMGKKNTDDTWSNAYINVQFRRGTEIKNGQDIDITEGFLTFDQYERDGKKTTTWKLFVLEFEFVNDEAEKPKAPNHQYAFNPEKDDIPF